MATKMSNNTWRVLSEKLYDVRAFGAEIEVHAMTPGREFVNEKVAHIVKPEHTREIPYYVVSFDGDHTWLCLNEYEIEVTFTALAKAYNVTDFSVYVIYRSTSEEE